MTLADLSGASVPLHRAVRFVEACGHRLEYVDIPAHQTDRPPLVLLHEGLGSVALWRDFPTRIAAATGCRTIAYSRYGFGRSSPRRAPYTPRFMHEEALEILPAIRSALDIDRPVLVGHSTGASMALIHAGDGRWNVRGVVAMTPFVFVDEFNLDSIRNAKALYETGMREKLARYHDDVETVFWGWRDIWLDPDFKSWSITHDLAGIRCPILAILGEEDEYCTPAQVEALEQHARQVPSFDFLKLADCRHSPHRDQPAVVLEAIARFIDELPA